MTDHEIIARLREAATCSTAVVVAEVLDVSLPTGLTQSALVGYFKRAFPDIPLRVLLDAGAWNRVSDGGLSDDQFDELLSRWFPSDGAVACFETALAAAQAAYEACDSVADMEPAFVALVEFIRKTPDVEPVAVARFVSAVRDGSLGPELMQFCLHVFRWPGVVAEAKRRLSEAEQPELLRGLQHLIAAGGEDWDDADMYLYFQ